jgi:hypothetical protein
MGINYGPLVTPTSVAFAADASLTVTANSPMTNIFKTSGSAAWDTQAYCGTPFTAPCTIEFNKQAASTDNGVSYAMIGWNADPTTDPSYSSIDWAAYPYATSTYVVYHNGTQVLASGVWDPAKKFYLVYNTDGYIRHWNGSTLLFSVNKGTGGTVYVDSSFYSVNSTYGGFSNLRVITRSWNGTSYTI